jgi:hypothetical protein
MRNKYRTIIIIAIVLIVYFFLFQKRNIYRIGKDTYVTTWKQWNGNTFVMPYKYYGLVPPQKNYFSVSTNSGLDLIFIDDSTIVIKSNSKSNSQEITSFDNYRYLYYIEYDYYENGKYLGKKDSLKINRGLQNSYLSKEYQFHKENNKLEDYMAFIIWRKMYEKPSFYEYKEKEVGW